MESSFFALIELESLWASFSAFSDFKRYSSGSNKATCIQLCLPNSRIVVLLFGPWKVLYKIEILRELCGKFDGFNDCELVTLKFDFIINIGAIHKSVEHAAVNRTSSNSVSTIARVRSPFSGEFPFSTVANATRLISSSSS